MNIEERVRRYIHGLEAIAGDEEFPPPLADMIVSTCVMFVDLERKACARLAESMECPVVAEAIRGRR
jgi:hypothetical protein